MDLKIINYFTKTLKYKFNIEYLLTEDMKEILPTIFNISEYQFIDFLHKSQHIEYIRHTNEMGYVTYEYIKMLGSIEDLSNINLILNRIDIEIFDWLEFDQKMTTDKLKMIYLEALANLNKSDKKKETCEKLKITYNLELELINKFDNYSELKFDVLERVKHIQDYYVKRFMFDPLDNYMIRLEPIKDPFKINECSTKQTN